MSGCIITYFSASGNTASVAKKLAFSMDAPLCEIKAAVPYTKADLDWRNENSRSSVEMKDPSSRPCFAPMTKDVSKYSTIFIGFPIWWYVAPHIINTFLEQIDCSGKTIIPFASSGGSGMGKTNEFLKNSCNGAFLKEGKVFPTNVSPDKLLKWVESVLY